jgi:hypothetical protein
MLLSTGRCTIEVFYFVAAREAVIANVFASLWVVVGSQSADFVPCEAKFSTKLASHLVLECLHALTLEHVLIKVPTASSCDWPFQLVELCQGDLWDCIVVIPRSEALPWTSDTLSLSLLQTPFAPLCVYPHGKITLVSFVLRIVAQPLHPKLIAKAVDVEHTDGVFFGRKTKHSKSFLHYLLVHIVRDNQPKCLNMQLTGMPVLPADIKHTAILNKRINSVNPAITSQVQLLLEEAVL